MNIRVQGGQGLSLEEIRAFLKGSSELSFQGHARQEVYGWVDETLRRQRYDQLGRAERGVIRQYIVKMTGLSRAQATRLITQYLGGEAVKPKTYRRRRFPSVYTGSDAELLAAVDEAHEILSGPATQKILYREYYDYKDGRYERLARISVAQLYRLRKSQKYRRRRVHYEKTKPAAVGIGERRKPESQGLPGYIRIDCVHQGDLDGEKGLYHINAVDEVTQWEVVGAAPYISEAWLLPVLKAMLEQFPFRIRGFHSDNGSEFINYKVAKLLEKLRVEQTKSRPRRSNDNGLAEAKNGAVIRKHIGYRHIASPHAESFMQFYREHFNPYLNFHRPCGFAEMKQDAKGKKKRIYPWYATPWEALRRLPTVVCSLKEGHTIEALDKQAGLLSDTAAAAQMQRAKQALLSSINQKRTA
ncbi:MAG: transposase family protein [Bryobacteraceae bacterium]|nr:transposase family protein [Bryobacteraceae bacterium]